MKQLHGKVDCMCMVEREDTFVHLLISYFTCILQRIKIQKNN